MADKYILREVIQMSNEEKLTKVGINWYPGHMAKTRREIKEVLSLIDIVVCILDSRIPYSSFLNGMEEYIQNKKKIIIMNKYDLCDNDETNKWINKYTKEGYNVLKTNLKDGNSYKDVINLIEKLMEPVNEKRASKGLLKAKAKVLVLGVPNVGKSTLINKISGKTKVNVGNQPGVTKSLSWIKVNDNIDLLDSPGLLLPKISSEKVGLNLASMTSIKETVLPIDTVAVYILNMLNDYYPNILKENYGISEIDKEDFVTTYHLIADNRGIKTRDEDDMFQRVSIMILNDIKSEKVKGITFDRYGE